MYPTASPDKLFLDPCKSMWNSPVKVDLFSSAIFQSSFSSNIGLFLLDYLCFCVFCLFICWNIMASAPKNPKLSQEEPTRVTITYPVDEEQWGKGFATRTWLVKVNFITFLANFQSSTGLYYVARMSITWCEPAVCMIQVCWSWPWTCCAHSWPLQEGRPQHYITQWDLAADGWCCRCRCHSVRS